MTPDEDAALAAVKLARERTPEQIGAVCAACRDNGMEELADVLIGSIPFAIAEQDWRLQPKDGRDG